MMAIMPMRDEESHGADKHYESHKLVLSVYDKNIENVVAPIGDNANTNWACPQRLDPFFVGCQSHGFILAVKDILVSYEYIVEKVHRVMKKMSFQIPAAKLHKPTHLRLKLRNDTG